MEIRLVLSLAGSDRAAHTPQPGSAQAQTHPLGFMASHLWASSLSRPQMRSGPAAEKHSQGCVGHQPPSMGREKKGAQMGQMLLTSRRTYCQQEAHKTFSTTREGYWSSAQNSGLGKRNWSRFTDYREKPQSNYIFLY